MEKECCNKKRVEVALKSLGKEQLTIILEEDKKAEVVCPYCNKKYIFSKEELKDIINDKNIKG